MGKHTPGKWIYEPSDMTIRTMDVSSNAGMGDHKGVIIAELDSPEWRKTRPDSIPEKEANARLIAAAPEMYEALKAFQEWSEFPAMKDIFKKYGMQNVAQQVLSKLDGAQ